MLIRRKTEMDLHNDRLFLTSDSRPSTEHSPRTSSPLFNRKTSGSDVDVPEEYKKFCEGLDKPPKKTLVLNRGVKMSLPPDESFISGQFFTKEDLDMFNEPIKAEDIRQTLSNRIVGLLNSSYKKLIRKTSGLFNKKRNQDPSRACLNINDPDCDCRRKQFLDLGKAKSGRGVCSTSKANIILL